MTSPAMTDAELERHIKQCGIHMESAMEQGNRQEAMDWLQAKTLAIGQRSPAQVARMTTQAERAIDDGQDYFSVIGLRHAAAIRQGGPNGR